MKTNKILLKHLAPTLVTAGCAITLITGTLVYAGVSGIKDTGKLRAQDIFISTTILAALAMLVSPVIDSYKSSDKFASKTASKYIKQVMKEHPELKDFDSVLTNPKALKSVTTMISNSLSPKNQKRILQSIQKVQQYAYHSVPKTISAMQEAQKEIVQILQEHAAVHPNFINEIYAAMAYADTTYVMPAKQNIR
jgi:RecG-like helicase